MIRRYTKHFSFIGYSIIRWRFVLFMPVLLAYSCATLPDIGLTKAYKASVKYVSVSRGIRSPGPQDAIKSMGAAGGAAAAMPGVVASGVGAAIAAPVVGLAAGVGAIIEGKRAKAISNMLDKRIDLGKYISQTLFEKFVTSLKESMAFEYVEPIEQIKPDAEFLLIVTQYGFGSGRYCQKRKPILGVVGMLVSNPPFQINWKEGGPICSYSLEIEDSDQHPIIWRKSSKLNGKAPTLPSYTMTEYLDDPENIREVFSKACEIVASEMIKDLKEEQS